MLESWQRKASGEPRMAFRARVILAAAGGASTEDIAEELGGRPATVSKWRTRFARRKLAGLGDAPRAGRPRRYDEETEGRILVMLPRSGRRGCIGPEPGASQLFDLPRSRGNLQAEQSGWGV